MPSKPPKEFWDRMTKEVKEKNPSYSQEQVDSTVGSIWYHKMSPSKKRTETKKSEGSLRVTASSYLIEGMARALWATCWADKMDERGLSGHLSGTEITEVMPEVPQKAYMIAEDLKKTIETTNGVNLDTFRPPGFGSEQLELGQGQEQADLTTWSAEDEKSFGWYLAMQSMGHGVSWSDDHEDHGLKLPLIENYELWDDADDAIDAEYGAETRGIDKYSRHVAKKELTISWSKWKNAYIIWEVAGYPIRTYEVMDPSWNQSIYQQALEEATKLAAGGTVKTDFSAKQQLDEASPEDSINKDPGQDRWRASLRVEALPVKKWVGSAPEQCDICGAPIADQPWWVDGATRMGPWANMCPNCFAQNGVGLGLGRGQKYDTRTLEKIEGNMRIEAQSAFPNMFSSEAKRWILTQTKLLAAMKSKTSASPEQTMAFIEQAIKEVSQQLAQAATAEVERIVNQDARQKIFDEIAVPQDVTEPQQQQPVAAPAPVAPAPQVPMSAPAEPVPESAPAPVAASLMPRALRIAFDATDTTVKRAKVIRAQDIGGIDENSRTITSQPGGPGKFSDNVDEFIYSQWANGFADETIGDEYFGVYSLVTFDPPMNIMSETGTEVLGGAILYESEQGFVQTNRFETGDEARMEFKRLEDEYAQFSPGEEEELGEPSPGEGEAPLIPTGQL